MTPRTPQADHGTPMDDRKFTARNGMTVLVLRDGLGFHPPHLPLPSTFGIDSVKVEALREYFEHERDKQLKRERVAGYPDWFVVREGEGLRVCHEGMARVYGFTRDNRHDYSYDLNGRTAHDIARLWFEANPVKKPWHAAKPREVWLVTYERNAEPEPAVVGRHDGALYFFHGDERKSLLNTAILHAKLLWSPDDLEDL